MSSDPQSAPRPVRVAAPATSPQVGVPFRCLREEDAGDRKRIEPYLRAVEAAGGQAVPISLRMSRPGLDRLTRQLDAFVLPGSPADVNPERYGAARHPCSANPDPRREDTNYALLAHAFAEHKPVLAICYGVQLLNVYLGGTLVQDISSELVAALEHDWDDREAGAPEPFHPVRIEPACELARLAGAGETRVNTSHHQAIREPGRHLRIVAHAPDGVIEAVEWTGDGPARDSGNWIVGVQWHPERMTADALASALFRELVAAARGAAAHR